MSVTEGVCMEAGYSEPRGERATSLRERGKRGLNKT